MAQIEVKVVIYPVTALCALVGNPQPCCWATETVGYRVQQNETDGTGDWGCFKSREVGTYAEARKVAKLWESVARKQGYHVHAVPRLAA